MSLLELSKANPESFAGYKARQIVAFAGDGKLKDGSECCEQLRLYLETVTSDRLASYANECLEHGFEDSGLVLQDVINEIGRRLEFAVQNGRYRGVQNDIGFDGLWNVPGEHTILVEVKTTDTYNVSLETVANYRARAIPLGIMQPSSVLFVVGRKDTGALEAQIRGSRYAWEMRVVGVDSLIKLLRVKEKSSEDNTIAQIRDLLQPFEYTRVDRILEVVFSAATDVDDLQSDDSSMEGASEESAKGQHDRTPQVKIDDVRLRVISGLNKTKNLNLVRKRQALFEDKVSDSRAVVSVSKRYDSDVQPYWYAYHPKWDDFLASVAGGYMVFGCVDRADAFAIPVDLMKTFLPSLNQTIRDDGTNYWHVKFSIDENENKVELFASKTGERFSLDEYRIPLL